VILVYLHFALYVLQLYEYSELGSLKACLVTAPDAFGEFIITVTMLLTYAVQVMHALRYLETRGYVHGNLAACNVMLALRDQVCC
jgi:Protein tyrosine and serine/threonine kinase